MQSNNRPQNSQAPQPRVVRPVVRGTAASKRKKRNSRARMPAIIFSICIALASMWLLIAIDNNRVTTATYTLSVPGLASHLEGFTVVQLSDLNGASLGNDQQHLISALNNIKFDVICMTGDMVGESGDPQPVIKLLDGLGTRKPVLFITGDSDPDPLKSTFSDNATPYADYIDAITAHGATYLDSPYQLRVGNASVWFTSGMHLNIDAQQTLADAQRMYDSALPNASLDPETLLKAAYRLTWASQLSSAVKGMKPEDIHISLSHVPFTDDFVRSLLYAEGDNSAAAGSDQPSPRYLRLIDVALCGHYAGGQWRLPIFGALYVPDERLERGGWFPKQEYVSGVRSINSVNVVTSAGLGPSNAYNLPAFRLFNAPQVTVIKLTGKLSQGK